MCCTLAPANLSETIVYAHQMADGRHVLGYQNKASTAKTSSSYSVYRDPFYRAIGANPTSNGLATPPKVNAMILPIPSKGEMGPGNAVDLREDKTVLKDYAKTILSLKSGQRSFSKGIALKSADSVQVFKTGSYEVVLAKQPRLLPNVVSELHPDVPLNSELMEAYAAWYEGWHVAVCFWSGDIEPEPIMFTYEPMFRHFLFAPTLDSHTGGVPPRYASLDHTILFGSQKGLQVKRQTTTPAHLKPYFSDCVLGFIPSKHMLNGDYWFPTNQLGLEDWEWTQNVTLRLPAGARPEA